MSTCHILKTNFKPLACILIGSEDGDNFRPTIVFVYTPIIQYTSVANQILFPIKIQCLEEKLHFLKCSQCVEFSRHEKSSLSLWDKNSNTWWANIYKYPNRYTYIPWLVPCNIHCKTTHPVPEIRKLSEYSWGKSNKLYELMREMGEKWGVEQCEWVHQVVYSE